MSKFSNFLGVLRCCNDVKYLDRQVGANSVDPDPTEEQDQTEEQSDQDLLFFSSPEQRSQRTIVLSPVQR